jgi:PKD repeat protein
MPTTADVTISATNVAPKVGSITAPAEPVVVGTVVNASAPFSDPGRMDRHTAVWDWGDGTTTSPATVTQGAGSGSVKDHHTYMRSGRFTIRLTVTDDDGGKGSATHTLTVLSPSKAIESLIDRVEGLNLPRGIQNELTSKLSNALDDLGRGRDQGAVGKLNAFVNSVKAQRGKKISAAEADALIQTAQGIINAIKAGLR